MSLTGAIYKLTDKELKVQIDNNFSSLTDLNEETDLSYFAIDFLEIMSKYSEFGRDFVQKILHGNHSFNHDNSFIGYSNCTEVRIDKNEILDKISIEIFHDYLQKGEKEGNPHSPKQNIEFLDKYFKNIKSSYESATNENKALIFRLG